jgi:hypothetical protein
MNIRLEVKKTIGIGIAAIAQANPIIGYNKKNTL